MNKIYTKLLHSFTKYMGKENINLSAADLK